MNISKLAFPMERVIFLQEALDRRLFGPVYHGTTSEARERIDEEGFRIFEGEAGQGPIAHGFEDNREYALGLPPPIHFLGFGVYLTSSQSVGKKFNGGSLKGLKVYYLDVPRMETINFNTPHTMMKWWLKNGYNPQVAKIDRVAATRMLTDSLKSRFDAVYHKGGGWTRIDLGPQVVVFDPSRIYMVDPGLAQPGDMGSKVIRKADGMRGILMAVRPIPPEIGRQYHGGAERFLEVRWQRGGRDYNVYDRDISFAQPGASGKTA